MKVTVFALKKELKKLADLQRAKNLQRFFKTGKGDYGEGDVFLGITVPLSRKIAIRFKELDLSSIEKLLHSKFHEERLIVLLILVHNFEKGDENLKKRIYNFYLEHTKYINNWDLVDSSADKIVGSYLFARQSRLSDDTQLINIKSSIKSASLSKIRHQSETKPNFNSSESGLPRANNVLLKLAKSKSLWERRIAVLATFQFIKNKQYSDSLEIAEILLNDEHDLIH
ncbi:MAG: DNA alkylation repair protein, partial [Candidatus Levybacteria bacterium]|nr:DNA alkylation repair protein [Candidatus Levybacteria bacterium]